MIGVSGVFFLLFLQVIRRIYGVIPDKSYPGKDKSEISLLSLTIYISESFYSGIYLRKISFWNRPWFIHFVDRVSYLSRPSFIYWLTLSVLFLLGVSTFLLDSCDFSVLFTVSILFLWNRRSGGFLHHIRFCFPFFVNRISSSFFDNRVNSSDQWLFGIIQIPTCFSNLFTWIIKLLRQWANDIGWHDFSAWYSPQW